MTPMAVVERKRTLTAEPSSFYCDERAVSPGAARWTTEVRAIASCASPVIST